MSTILDALRKSERARRHRQAPVYRDASAQETPVILRWLALTAGLVLLVALGLSAWLMTRSPADLTVAPTQTVPESPVKTLAPGRPSTTGDAAAKEMNTPKPSAHTPTPVTEPQPLSAQATSDGQQSDNQTPASEPGSAKTVPDVAVPTEGVPWLSSLPASFRNRLPALVVNIHVFAEDEAQRILYINNRPYKRGEQIQGGVVVEAIVPDGVVLRAFGQRFKLPRPT
jgi:hypothetical protein